MIPTGVQSELTGEPRPTGIVQPPQESAVRVIRALGEKRLRDAQEHIDALPDTTPFDSAWKQFLCALLAVEQGDYAVAVPLLQTVASKAPTTNRGLKAARSSALGTTTGHPDRDSLRLAARALEKVGWIFRRQERPRDAYRVHLCAYHIRNEHGSFEEVWESARSLGLAADLEGRHTDGEVWYRIAADAGARASEDPEGKQAATWTSLSASLVKSGLYDQAVDAARTAQRWWHEHDIGDVAAARADMNLGYALLKQGESLHDNDPAGAKAVLDEALKCLEASREALLAFGHVGPTFSRSTDADARWCDEQTDFARRLRDSLEL